MTSDVMAKPTMAAAQPRDAGALFRNHARFVARFLARLGVDRQEVDDLVQEVFMVAHRRGGYVDGLARPTTWLAEIALRVASTRRRTLRRRQEESDPAAVAAARSGAPTPADALETSQALGRVEKALGALDLDRRAVFVLYELEEESCEVIAAGLGKPVGTIYSRLHSARRQFSEAHARLVAAEQAVVSGGKS